MRNKEIINGTSGARPCFFAFNDSAFPDIFWLIPLCSRVEKYHTIYNHKMEKNGRCDTIVFGELFEKESVFLIQNMCPATLQYMKPYQNKLGGPVQIDSQLARELISKARTILKLEKKGKHILFSDSLAIYERLKIE